MNKQIVKLLNKKLPKQYFFKKVLEYNKAGLKDNIKRFKSLLKKNNEIILKISHFFHNIFILFQFFYYSLML